MTATILLVHTSRALRREVISYFSRSVAVCDPEDDNRCAATSESIPNHDVWTPCFHTPADVPRYRRHGIVYCGGRPWNGVHETWLRGQQFTHRGIQLAFDADVEAMLLTLDRRNRLDKAIAEMTADGEYTAVVHRLGCLRGVSTLTAFGLAVEVGDWHRFTGATIGAYLGLVPTESSSGRQRSQGSITKAGNTHARRLLVEAAWHHRRSYRTPGPVMRARWNLASPAAKAAVTPATIGCTSVGRPSSPVGRRP